MYFFCFYDRGGRGGEGGGRFFLGYIAGRRGRFCLDVFEVDSGFEGRLGILGWGRFGFIVVFVGIRVMGVSCSVWVRGLFRVSVFL